MNSTVQEAQSGGSIKSISRTTLSSQSVICILPDTRSNVPKSPAVTLFISPPRLTMCPQRVRKTKLMNSPNTEGIKNSPNIAALATTRHFTSAEIVCDNSASNSIQTTLPMTIALAIQRFALNQANPSRYDCRKKSNNCGTHVTADNRINITDIFPITY